MLVPVTGLALATAVTVGPHALAEDGTGAGAAPAVVTCDAGHGPGGSTVRRDGDVQDGVVTVRVRGGAGRGGSGARALLVDGRSGVVLGAYPDGTRVVRVEAPGTTPGAHVGRSGVVFVRGSGPLLLRVEDAGGAGVASTVCVGASVAVTAVSAG